MELNITSSETIVVIFFSVYWRINNNHKKEYVDAFTFIVQTIINREAINVNLSTTLINLKVFLKKYLGVLPIFITAIKS